MNDERALASMKEKVELLEGVLEEAKKLIPIYLSKEWKHLKTIDTLEIYKSEACNDSPIFSVKATHSEPYITYREPEEILNHVMRFYVDGKLTQKFLPILHPHFPFYRSYHIKDEIYVMHLRFSSGTFLVQDRDYLNVRTIVKESDDEVYFISCAVPEDITEPFWPRDKACIRGSVTIYYISIKKVAPNRIKFEFLSHSDPKGVLPSWITNWKAKEESKILLRYKKLLGTWLSTKPKTPVIEISQKKLESISSSGSESKNEILESTEDEDPRTNDEKIISDLRSQLREKNNEIEKLEQTLETYQIEEDITENEVIVNMKEKEAKQSIKETILTYFYVLIIIIQGFYINVYTIIFFIIEFLVYSFIGKSLLIIFYEHLSEAKVRLVMSLVILGMWYFDIKIGYFILNALLLISFLNIGKGKIKNLFMST